MQGVSWGKVLFAIRKLWHTAPVCLNFYGQCGRMWMTLCKNCLTKQQKATTVSQLAVGTCRVRGPPAGR